MKRKPVTSSNIKSIGYDEINNSLQIEFASGDIYNYFNVSKKEYNSMMNASSIGAYFHKFIKNNYHIRETEFHEDLVVLMRAHSAFSELSVEPKYKKDGRFISPDIVCKYKGKTLIIETKMRVPAIISEIKSAIIQMEKYVGIAEDAQLVLAIPGVLQSSYIDIFKEKGIEIWDIEIIAQIFHNQLNLIRDHFLYKLLSNTDREISTSERLIKNLKQIKNGKEEWALYQKLLVDIFEYLFVPPLSKPFYESSDQEKVNRRDIIIPNYSEAGFWAFLRNKYIADYLVIDAKNYKGELKKENILQMSNYLKDYGAGHFGIICGRTMPSASARVIQREQWIVQRKMIIFLDDEDIIQMLAMKDMSQMCEEVIKQKIEEFRLKL